MYLAYFKEPAYDKLINEIDKNFDKYKEDKNWLPEYFGTDDYFSTSSKFVGQPTLQYQVGTISDEQKSIEDLINIRLLYDSFKEITPLQATNKYMWTYLSHFVFRDYVINRWMDAPRENTIKTRFFVTGGKNSLFDNAISRLWWYGYLTYDEENSNHYHLTEILLLNQTICTDVIDTKFKMNSSVLKGILKAIKEYKDEIPPNESIIDCFRACNKYLNRYAAVTIIDFLDSEEIKNIALSYMREYRKANASLVLV